jgi:hypothetical protein
MDWFSSHLPFGKKSTRLTKVVPEAPDDLARPIFVFAHPRSGSTLLQRLLNSLDGVIIYGEHLGILKGVAKSYLDFMNRRGHPFCSENPDAAEVHAQNLARLKDPSDFSPNANGLSYPHVRASFRRFVGQLLHPIHEPQFQRWGFKEIRYGGDDFVFEMLLDLFPRATFLLLVRHPFEQITSLQGTGWAPKPLDVRAQAWRDQAVAFLKYRQASPDHTFLLRYEDLTSRDSGAAGRLIEALGHAFGAPQEEILFDLGKVGATAQKPDLSPEDLEMIRTICFVPETSGVYVA